MNLKLAAVLCAFLSLSSVQVFGQGNVYPRNETIFVGGGMWGAPNNWNPITPWSATVGTPGLVYEYLFHFDPINDQLKPWLAESGAWDNKNTYTLKLRKDIKWKDGTPFTAEDVKFTYEVAKKHKEVDYSIIWNWMSDIKVVDQQTVKFTFSDPRYHEWQYELYNRLMLPKHIFSSKTKEEILTGANENPIGTGSYVAETHDQDRMVYLRNDDWWGIKQLGFTPVPKRIVYLKASGNHVALGMHMKGELDMSNYFLPGIPTLKKTYGLHTWHTGAPYMLSDNTAILMINNTKKPLNDSKLRKAMAFAIDSKMISQVVFEQMVLPSNSVGILPIKSWEKYYDSSIEKKLGFSYDPTKAKEMLDNAGYKDKDGDGMREAPDGQKMKFSIMVPNGWSDWEESIKIIAKNLQAVGINCETSFPDFNLYLSKRNNGDYDMAIANDGSSVSATPYSYFQFLFRDIVNNVAATGNYERYTNPQMKKLLNELNRIPFDKEDDIKKAITKMSELLLEDMPMIPLWYNGMWFQASTAHWENWPSASNPYAYPCIWNNRWQYGAIEMLSKIKPKQ